MPISYLSQKQWQGEALNVPQNANIRAEKEK